MANIARLQMLYNHIKSIPAELINLRSIDTVKDKVTGLKYGAVGCICGWGCSMPAFRRWARKKHYGLQWGKLEEYLGTYDKPVNGTYLFSGKDIASQPDKQQALQRIRNFIKAAKRGDI